jgi:hypothetical protein
VRQRRVVEEVADGDEGREMKRWWNLGGEAVVKYLRRSSSVGFVAL